jgi:hypothetical protein
VSDDYLWDRRGPADPDVARLERVLGRLRSEPPMPDWHRAAPHARGARHVSLTYFAAAAALVLACGASLWLARGTAGAAPSWAVVRVTGQPTVGDEQIAEAGRLAVGAWLQTDPASSASVAIADIGRLDVDADTRLQLLGTRDGRHRVALQRGTVHALIWAPPGEFVVETEASTAIDLGCAYTLTVAPGGNGMIEVSMGWVGFEHGGREAFIPAGARCATRPGIGPGTPYYADAAEPMRQAIDRLDFAGLDPAARRHALGEILAGARPKDAMTLWHLLARVPAEDRDPVYDGLARLVPPPASVTRDGIRAGNRAMRDAWWDSLGLGTSSWWRIWERSWR